MDAFLGIIIHPLELGLASLALATGNAALAVILCTLLIRLLLSPLQVAQLRNAAAMQRLQPHLTALRRKYGKNQRKLLVATRKLHRQHRVNPHLGVVLAVLQLPFLVGLTYALAHLGMAPLGFPHAVNFARSACHGIAVHNWSQWFDACYAVSGAAGGNPHVWRLFHAHILWLNRGLAGPDPLYILPTLAGAAQWLQTRLMRIKSDDPQQHALNRAANFVPLVVVLFAAHAAAGLSMYWIVSAVFGIAVQTMIVRGNFSPEVRPPR